jgi:hypothetical protein
MSEPTMKGLPLSWWQARFSYDPDTGVITGPRSQQKPRPDGYVKVSAWNGSGTCVHVFGHRLAWFLAYRQSPPDVIDHINGNPSDNRLANLRPATRTQNLINSKLRVDNSSGFKGVSWNKKSEKWVAQIQIRGKRHRIGFFDCPREAHHAYMEEARAHYGEFARSS